MRGRYWFAFGFVLWLAIVVACCSAHAIQPQKKVHYNLTQLGQLTHQIVDDADALCDRQLLKTEWGDYLSADEREADLNKRAGELRDLIKEWQLATKTP